jgi:hypothetical protein
MNQALYAHMNNKRKMKKKKKKDKSKPGRNVYNTHMIKGLYPKYVKNSRI